MPRGRTLIDFSDNKIYHCYDYLGIAKEVVIENPKYLKYGSEKNGIELFDFEPNGYLDWLVIFHRSYPITHPSVFKCWEKILDEQIDEKEKLMNCSFNNSFVPYYSKLNSIFCTYGNNVVCGVNTKKFFMWDYEFMKKIRPSKFGGLENGKNQKILVEKHQLKLKQIILEFINI